MDNPEPAAASLNQDSINAMVVAQLTALTSQITELANAVKATVISPPSVNATLPAVPTPVFATINAATASAPTVSVSAAPVQAASTFATNAPAPIATASSSAAASDVSEPLTTFNQVNEVNIRSNETPLTSLSFSLDFTRDMKSYDGSSDSDAAREWLTTWTSIVTIHGLRDRVAIELARRTLVGAAKAWYIRCHNRLVSIAEFKRLFRSAFLPQQDTIEIMQRMVSREQKIGEDIMAYIHDKLRLLQPLYLNMAEVKKYVSRGCKWSALASHILNSNAMDEDELVTAIRTFVECQPPRTTVPKPRVTQSTIVNSSSTKPATATATPANTGIGKRSAANNYNRCYNCFEVGHLSSQCTAPRRPVKCTICSETGHVRAKCPTVATKTPSKPSSAPTTASTMTIMPTQMNEEMPTKYHRPVTVDGIVISNCMIDPGSCDCIIAISVATTLPNRVIPCEKLFTGIGADKEPTRSFGYLRSIVKIDDVELEVPVYLVPDHAIPVGLIIGRTWTEDPSVVFARVGNMLRFLPLDEFTARQLAEMVEHTRETVSQTTKLILRDSLPLTNQHFVGFVTALGPTIPCLFPVANDAVGLIMPQKCNEFVVPITVRSSKPCLPAGSCIGRVLSIEATEVVPSPNKSLELWKPFTLEEVTVGATLNQDEKLRLIKLINKYRHAFAVNIRELGCTNIVQMRIEEVPGSVPCAQRPYRSPMPQARALSEIISEWEDLGIVQPSSSPYAAPALLVDKKTGEKRPVFDYRRLNAQTVAQPFPMPHIDDQLSELGTAKLYSIIDLFSGYLQVPMHPESIHKTAFVTTTGHYEFTRMPFGLKNAPAVFQGLMNRVLGNLQHRIAFCYLDDIIVPAGNFEQMLQRLTEVLSALQEAHLTCRLNKCQFAVEKIEFLGFEISAGHIKPGIAKTQAIAEFPRPKDAHEIRRFLGLTGFFRRFIRHYAVIASPLSELLKKNVEFTWKAAQEDAFVTLREKLTTSPVLRLFDPKAPIEVHTDASAKGIGGMLLQVHSGKRHLVYAVSKTCSQSESLYHSSRLELLAIVWTLTRLRQFLLGVQFTVVTDCQCLTYLHRAKVGNGQMARWAILIAEFDCKFQHRPGTNMAHVDAISRAPSAEKEPQSISDSIVTASPAYMLLVETTEVATVRAFQAQDNEICNLIRYIGLSRSLDEEMRKYAVIDGILYRRADHDQKLLLVAPRTLRKALVIKFHDEMGHYSTEKVVAAISRQYWFSGMRRYVKTHIRRCVACLTRKGPSGRVQGLLRPIPPPKIPFEVIHADHIGPLPVSGNFGHLFVVIDALTRYVELYPCEGTTSPETVSHLEELTTRFGYPKHIVTDRGSAFTAGEFKIWIETHSINHTLVSTRHPQGNGLVERVNRVLIPQFAIYCSEEGQTDWSKHVSRIRRNINASINRSTGHSPFELLYGYQPHFVDMELAALLTDDDARQDPNTMRKVAIDQITIAQQEQKRNFDRRHCPGDELDVGQIVFAKTAPEATGAPTKFQPKYRGPLVVVKKVAPDTYRCQSLNTQGTILDTNFHISSLRALGDIPISDDEDNAAEESADL